jgi:hypothetical protein
MLVHPLRAVLLFALASALGLAAMIPTPARSAVPPGTAYVVGTYDGSVLRLYVDGKLVAQQNSTAAIKGGPTPVEIGSFLGREGWYGTLDEVAVYDRALSAGTIQAHYKLGSGRTGGNYEREIRRTPGVAAYWRLDDPSSSRARDVLGNHPGVYRPGTALRVPGLLSGTRDQAAAFDGATGDVVVTGAQDLSFSSGFTLEAWAAPGARRDQSVVSKVDSWFLKTNFSGQWGVGFLTKVNPPIVSVYSKQPSSVAASPIPLAAQQQPGPAPAPGSSPPAAKKSSKSNTALITWIAILVVVGGGWLLWRWRRNAEPLDDYDEDDDAERPERPPVTVPASEPRRENPDADEAVERDSPPES